MKEQNDAGAPLIDPGVRPVLKLFRRVDGDLRSLIMGYRLGGSLRYDREFWTEAPWGPLGAGFGIFCYPDTPDGVRRARRQLTGFVSLDDVELWRVDAAGTFEPFADTIDPHWLSLLEDGSMTVDPDTPHGMCGPVHLEPGHILMAHAVRPARRLAADYRIYGWLDSRGRRGRG